MTVRRVRCAVAAVTVLLALAVPGALPVAAATTFERPTATATYGSSVDFRQPVTLNERMKRVEILLDFPGGAGPEVVEVDGARQPGSATLRYSLETTRGLLPNTTIGARWRLTSVGGAVELGPPVTVRYEDTRFKWKVRAGDVVRVHWYEGSDAFGTRALGIGERAVRETSQLLGVTETEPVDFFVYADRDAFYDALGPGTRENVGGQANASIRTLFALITPSEIDDDWVGTVIPHELTHLVFDTAVDNPYHFPPRWLNEGLAVYLSQGYEAGDRAAVMAAAEDGSLMPLEGLAGDFPTTRDRFFLAYAESVSAIDYLVRTYGRDDLVALVRSYSRGVTDDEAFTAALGVDVAEFDAAWRADIKAKEPIVRGPRPAPPGPLPPGWAQADGSPGLPLPSVAPGAPAPSGSGPGSAVGTGRPPSTLPIVIAAIGMLAAVAAVGYGLARPRRRPPVAIAPTATGPDASSAGPDASPAGPDAGSGGSTVGSTGSDPPRPDPGP